MAAVEITQNERVLSPRGNAIIYRPPPNLQLKFNKGQVKSGQVPKDIFMRVLHKIRTRHHSAIFESDDANDWISKANLQPFRGRLIVETINKGFVLDRKPWYKLLAKGWHVPTVGGTDAHNADAVGPPPPRNEGGWQSRYDGIDPKYWAYSLVFANSTKEHAILDALLQGRTVAARGLWKHISVTAYDSRRKYLGMIGDTVHEAKTLRIKAQSSDSNIKRLQVISVKSSKPIAERRPNRRSTVFSVSVRGVKGAIVIEAENRNGGIAISSPVYLR